MLTPADNDLLYDKQDVAGDYVVSDIQLYLDLAGHPGRGEENAEFLLDNLTKGLDRDGEEIRAE